LGSSELTTMSEKQKNGTPLTGPYGSFDRRRAIDRWEDVGWTFLHWTEVPQVLAILEHVLGEIIFLDENGWAWQGPTFDKTKPVPLDKYPPALQILVEIRFTMLLEGITSVEPNDP
jgi:hypothetical protein